jgi:hypothetical protein
MTTADPVLGARPPLAPILLWVQQLVAEALSLHSYPVSQRAHCAPRVIPLTQHLLVSNWRTFESRYRGMTRHALPCCIIGPDSGCQRGSTSPSCATLRGRLGREGPSPLQAGGGGGWMSRPSVSAPRQAHPVASCDMNASESPRVALDVGRVPRRGHGPSAERLASRNTSPPLHRRQTRASTHRPREGGGPGACRVFRAPSAPRGPFRRDPAPLVPRPPGLRDSRPCRAERVKVPPAGG